MGHCPEGKVEVKSLAKIAVQAGGLNTCVILHRFSVCRPRHLIVYSNDFLVFLHWACTCADHVAQCM